MEKALVVLAAGMGSRYGGLKQMDPIGPKGEFILDYSVNDALAAGFDKIVFVIRPDIEKDFREIVGSHWENFANVEYAMQKRDDVPASFSIPLERTKPWGTAQAVLAARNAVKDAFAVVNADDYYGPEALKLTADFLDSSATASAHHCLVGYRLDNTLSDFATVSRGICSYDPDTNLLTTVKEALKLKRDSDGVIRDGEGPDAPSFPDNTPVSMNMWGFKRSYIDHLADDFPRFLEKYGSLPKSEFQIPTTMASLMRRDLAKVTLLTTSSRWFGVTSREDRPGVETFFKTIPSPLHF